jgi:hypothetical protein
MISCVNNDPGIDTSSVGNASAQSRVDPGRLSSVGSPLSLVKSWDMVDKFQTSRAPGPSLSLAPYSDGRASKLNPASADQGKRTRSPVGEIRETKSQAGG